MEFIKTPVNVADDVERPMLMLQIVPERLSFDDYIINFFRRREFEDVPKAFSLQVANRPAQLLALLPDHVRSKVAIGSISVAILTESLREIEDKGDGYHVILTRQSYEWLTCLRLNVGRVNDSKLARLEPLGPDKVQHLKSCISRCLIILVIGNQTTAEI